MVIEAAPGAAPIRVLVVEDDELVRRMLVRVLERRGFETYEAPDGHSALDLVAGHEVDIVLLDNGLPDIRGTEVLAALRAEPASATLPVILVTGQADIEARVGGLQAGADDYLVKPVNMDELVARVNAQIRGRDAWRSQVQERLHERARLAAAVAAIPADGGAVDVAERLVTVLGEIPGVDSVGITELKLDGSGWVLAATRPRSPEDRTTIESWTIPELREVVRDGAAVVSSPLAEAITSTPHDGVIATPIEVEGRIAAVVVLGISASSGTDARDVTLEALSAAIDLSPVIEHVLGPLLAARQDSQSVSAEVEHIITAEAFHPVFQCLVEVCSGTTMGYEALTRFDDGARPDLRFAEAAAVGLGVELELATLRAALRDAQRLPADHYLSVNVSAALLTSGRLAAALLDAGDRALVVELTEHERIDDYDVVRSELEALGPGLRWSVDDAGSGWASLRHVFALRPHFVKLDRSWIRGIDDDRARQALLLGLGRFVQELDGHLVAEGIETPAELDTLRRLEVPYGQGYLLGRPVPIDEALAG